MPYNAYLFHVSIVFLKLLKNENQKLNGGMSRSSIITDEAGRSDILTAITFQ